MIAGHFQGRGNNNDQIWHNVKLNVYTYTLLCADQWRVYCRDNRRDISADKGAAILNFTEAGIKDIVTVFNHWRDGSEDFCLFPRGKKSELKAKEIESWEIWFWVNMMP